MIPLCLYQHRDIVGTQCNICWHRRLVVEQEELGLKDPVCILALSLQLCAPGKSSLSEVQCAATWVMMPLPQRVVVWVK